MFVGTSVKKIDGLEKFTGSARYTVDLQLPRMLHAKVKRSTVAHTNQTGYLPVRLSSSARMESNAGASTSPKR